MRLLRFPDKAGFARNDNVGAWREIPSGSVRRRLFNKFASCKKAFKDLDAFIRMRLRRWLLNQKELLPKEGNLVLTNKVLGNMGLKSLVEIRERFDNKNRQKTRKIGKNKLKTGQKIKSSNWRELEEVEFKYNQKLILEQLKELTSLVKKVERRVGKIEKKLEMMKEL